MRAIIGFLSVLVFLASAAYGATLYVGPGEIHTTIQLAIDASSDGDVIIVRDGTYTGEGNRDIDFKGKAVHLKSANGPEMCIIDAQGTEVEPHRGFHLHSGEDGNAIVEGFTITGGYAHDPAGGYGGGVLCDGASPTIIGNVIMGSYAGPLGSAFGGALAALNASPTISGNVICGNSAGRSGGGICCSNSSSVISQNVIFSNNAQYRGGGGIYCEESSAVTLINSTVAGNDAAVRAGGIYVYESSPRVLNCIVWGNRVAGMEQGQIHLLWSHSSIRIDYTLVMGARTGVTVETGSSVVWGLGNIDADPLFANAAAGDYHLRSQYGRWNPNANGGVGGWALDDVTSPCIDAGDPSSEYSNEPQANGERVNIGAYGNTSEASKSYSTVPRTLIVSSTPFGGMSITGTRPGTTNYSVACDDAEGVNLILASPVMLWRGGNLYTFLYWRVDGQPQTRGQVEIQLPMNADHIATAVYNIYCDVNNDCKVNVLDLIIVRNRLGMNPATSENWKADVNQDGSINVIDLIKVRNELGAKCD